MNIVSNKLLKFQAFFVVFKLISNLSIIGILGGMNLTSPTGAKFVVSSVRHGVLPRICG
jgi:hypothetical protein